MLRLITLVSFLFIGINANAAGDAKHPKQMFWSFDTITGKVDKPSAQRGFQVYREVCASCHSVKRLAFRNLQDIGFMEAEVKTIANEYTVIDGPDDAGDLFERPAKASDRIPGPYANKQAAQASNGGAYPPDLSLITKARMDGPNYIYSLLTGYEEAPEGVELSPGQYYNPYMAGGKIAMAAPLSEGIIEYQDGTEASVEQMSKDITNFLQWAAEPETEHRKEMGIKVLLFLIVFTILFYIAKRRIWAKIGQ